MKPETLLQDQRTRPPDARENGHADPALVADRGYGPRTARAFTRVGVLAAARRHYVVAALPAIVLVAIAVALALTRPPTYTAQARLAVGRISLSQPAALGGYATATRSLAETYSRSISAAEVVEPVARKLRLPPAEVAARLSAAPIPESPVFRVQATGTAPERTVVLVNLASDRLIEYVTDLNRNNPDSKRLFRRFERASATLARRMTAQERARERYRVKDTARSRRAYVEAQALTESARLEVQTLRAGYHASAQGQAAAANLQLLAPARQALSSRRSRLQLLLFIGLLAGVPAGVALATLYANWRVRRIGAISANR